MSHVFHVLVEAEGSRDHAHLAAAQALQGATFLPQGCPQGLKLHPLLALNPYTIHYLHNINKQPEVKYLRTSN